MMALKKNTLMTIAAGVAAVAVLVWLFMPTPVAVDTASVFRAPMTLTIDGEGRTRVTEVYQVSAPVTGNIRRVQVHVGDRVSAGETVLLSILPTAPQFLDERARAQAEAAVKAAQAARDLAKAELDRVRAEWAFAKTNLDRAQALFAKQTISEKDLDQAELEEATHAAAVESARAMLKARAFDLETARAALIDPTSDVNGKTTCCVDVRSPVDGTVLQVLRESEGVVEVGTPLIEVGDPGNLEVVVDLLSSDAVRVREGAVVTITGWGGGAVLTGRVRRVEPYGFTKVSSLGIEEQRVNVIIDLTGARAAWGDLGHGFRVEVGIIEWHGDDVLQAPLGALFRNGDDWAVFVIEDGRAVRRSVAIGRRNDRTVEIASGLEPEETVIMHPSDQVTEGSGVRERGR